MEITQRRRIYDGVKIRLEELDMVAPDGRLVKRELVVHPGAVVVLPILDDGRVVLIRNERFAVNENLIELPAGTLEPGEDPALCAARELIEETGYEAAKLRKLSQFWTMPGVCNELMHAFVATGLRHVGQALEATEQITVELVTMDDALAMVRRGEIHDAKTIATLLHHRLFCAD